MIKAILFDWHGVLDNVLLEGMFRILSKQSNISVEVLKTKFRKKTRQVALGYISDNELFSFIGNDTGINKEQISELESYVNSISLNRDLWDYLVEIKKNYKFAILSDCPLQKANKIRKNIDLKLFDLVLFSGEIGLDKQMSEFFKAASKKLNIKSNEILFVDDSIKNIQFASDLNFQVHKFISTKYFKKAIEKTNNLFSN